MERVDIPVETQCTKCSHKGTLYYTPEQAKEIRNTMTRMWFAHGGARLFALATLTGLALGWLVGVR